MAVSCWLGTKGDLSCGAAWGAVLGLVGTPVTAEPAWVRGDSDLGAVPASEGGWGTLGGGADIIAADSPRSLWITAKQVCK